MPVCSSSGSLLPKALPVTLLLWVFWTAGCAGPASEESASQAQVPSPEPPVLADVGYQPRGCGFDLDDDGEVGEPEDDCRVCDGVTSDPDGDGVDEDLIYVACGEGTDAAGCGTPENPCGSIRFGWTLADGPADGAEDILCFRGRCAEGDLVPPVGGVDGVTVEPADGSAARSFEHPTNPAMLVGWDSDGDGVYPPFDGDDVAVLDGAPKAYSEGPAPGRAVILGDVSHLELAHFTVRDFGRRDPVSGSDADLPEDSGFLRVESAGGATSHLRIHDLALREINRDRAAGRRVSTFHLATDSRRLHWLSFENLLVTDNGGAFVLAPGVAEPPDSGPLRWRRVSRTAHGCDALDCDDAASSLVFAVSGHLTGLEVLDSWWDANVDHWLPKGQGGISGAAFVIAARATQDLVIRNNHILDHKNGLIVRGGATRDYGDRHPRPVDGIVFDGNRFHNRFDRWKYGDFAVEIRDGEDRHELVGSVAVTRNVLTSSTPWDGCIALRPASDHEEIPGRILIAHNTCRGPIDRYGALVIGDVEGKNRAFLQHRIVLRNNLVAGLATGDLNVLASYAPDQLDADGNVYADGPFSWDGRFRADLDAWREATGQEAASRACEPRFASDTGAELDPSDACARDAATPWTTGDEALDRWLGLDVDGEARPQGEGGDAGADEVVVGAVVDSPSSSDDSSAARPQI